MNPVFVQQLRRDRLNLPIWILATVLLLMTSAAAVSSEYGDAAGRAQILKVALATPALLALRGIPNGDSLGSAVHFQSYAFLAVTIGLMNTFLASRHGRADEERGRRELLLAAPISRLQPPLATLALGLLANGIFAVLATLGYRATGEDLTGSINSAATLAVTGLAFLGIGMVAGELTATSRAANGIGVIAVLGAYALRGAGDALGRADIANLTLEPAWPSWISPIGWGQQSLAFTENHWWPARALAGLAVLTVAGALAIHSRRELGASLLPDSAGRATAGPSLGTPLGLAWRLQWPTLTAWAIGSAVLGLVLGSLVTAISGANLDNPQIQEIIQSLGHTDDDLAKALIPALMVIVGAVAAAAGVQAVLRVREEETEGRTEELLATATSRITWLLSFTAIAAVTVIVVIAATGLASAAGFAAVGDTETGWLSLRQALVQIPAALTFVGFTALLVGVLPRLAVSLGWGVFGLGIGMGLFGDLLQLPQAVRDLSPISHIPSLPTTDWAATIVLGLVALAFAVIAAITFRRRDLAA